MDKEILEKLISFRREIHQYPQTSFQQFQTRKRIKKILIDFGVKEQQFKETEPTALIVDLSGEAQCQGQKKCIAFRADMDALTMIQTNHDLPYKSKIQGSAHMCGHDGHMACLVGFVYRYLKKIKQIPKNKIIRLLFQPSQEGPESGAKKMIEDGCLIGVDEVYGFHQWPTAPLGELWCKQGPVMSQITFLNLDIKGTSGHGSEPQNLKVSVVAAVQIYMKFITFLDKLMNQKPGKFVCTLPIFHAGERFNVISENSHIQGSIRSFENGLSHFIVNQMKKILQQYQEKGFECIFECKDQSPMNCNTAKQADHVLRVGQQVFGKQKVGPGKLPFKASQDFSYYTLQKPGAFFFLSTASSQNSPMIHNSNFNFNDDLIDKASQFWYKLALDRLVSENK